MAKLFFLFLVFLVVELAIAFPHDPYQKEAHEHDHEHNHDSQHHEHDHEKGFFHGKAGEHEHEHHDQVKADVHEHVHDHTVKADEHQHVHDHTVKADKYEHIHDHTVTADEHKHIYDHTVTADEHKHVHDHTVKADVHDHVHDQVKDDVHEHVHDQVKAGVHEHVHGQGKSVEHEHDHVHNHGKAGEHEHEHEHYHEHDHEHGHVHEHEHEHQHDHERVHVPKLTLNDKHHIPAIGLGTSVKGGSKHNEVQIAVEHAIDAGYRHIDTAENYDTEDQVGLAIKNKILEGKVKREELFITTKLWNDHHRKDLVVPALKESLHKLGLDYVDLYLIHWPVEDFKNYTFGETDYLDTWQGLEECKKLGLAKSIGVSNFNEKQIARIIKEAHVKPAALQIEVNPNLTQKKLIKYAQDNDIVVIGYAPLGSLPDAKKNPHSPPPSIDDPKLVALGHKYHKNTVQIVLRYLVERGVIPIPKSGNPKRLLENIDIFDFKLTPEEVEQIDHFNKDHRLIDVPEWKPHKYYPFGA